MSWFSIEKKCIEDGIKSSSRREKEKKVGCQEQAVTHTVRHPALGNCRVACTLSFLFLSSLS